MIVQIIPLEGYNPSDNETMQLINSLFEQNGYTVSWSYDCGSNMVSLNLPNGISIDFLNQYGQIIQIENS